MSVVVQTRHSNYRLMPGFRRKHYLVDEKLTGANLNNLSGFWEKNAAG